MIPFPASTGFVLHDYFAIRGGGERVAVTLAQGLGWPLVTGFVSDPLIDPKRSKRSPTYERGARGEVEEWPPGEVYPLGVQPGGLFHRTLSLIQAFRRWRPPQGVKVVIFSGTYAPLAAPTIAGIRKVYYCHSPPRFLYDQRDFFIRRLPSWQRPGFLALGVWLRRRYEEAVRAMDLVICNSQTVRERLRRYLGTEAQVVYPPVDTRKFRYLGQKGYYLSPARLDPLKRVDRIVEAFLGLPDQKLVVASGGPEETKLRYLAKGAPNIHFTSWVDDATLRRLIGQAVAVIYVPRAEDFGLSPVEAMAAGKPVIGVAEGGLLETVVDGETGLLLPPDPSPKAIQDAIRWLDAEKAMAMRAACELRAQNFDTDTFLARMREILSLFLMEAG